MSDRVRYLDIRDWRAVRAAGLDAGRKPHDPFEQRESVDPVIQPRHMVSGFGGMYGSDYSDERRRGQRGRQVDALLGELGIKKRMTSRADRALLLASMRRTSKASKPKELPLPVQRVKRDFGAVTKVW